MSKDKGYIIVFVTAGTEQEAEMLSRKIVENRLAACVSKTKVNSLFSWKEKLETEDEVLLIIKTSYDLYEKLEVLVKENHSYEVPEIIALPIVAGSKDYLEWIDESTKQ